MREDTIITGGSPCWQDLVGLVVGHGNTDAMYNNTTTGIKATLLCEMDV